MPRALIRRRTLGIMSAACAAGVFAPLLAARSRAAALGDRLTLAVAGQGEMYHLPVLLAEQLGFFKAEGLDVVLRDKAEWREKARKQLVEWFAVCGNAEAVSRGRRYLGMYLN